MSRQEQSRARAKLPGFTIALGRPTLADRFFDRVLLSDAVLIFAGAALTAILAHVEFSLWSMSVTGQILGVLLVGGTLGAMRAALSMVLYLLMVAFGLPVLPGGLGGVGYLTDANAGYVYGCVIAATFLGWLAQHFWNRQMLRALLSFLGASAVMVLIGTAWFAVAAHGSVLEAPYRGVLALSSEALLGSALATIVIGLVWRHVGEDDRRRAQDDLAVRD